MSGARTALSILAAMVLVMAVFVVTLHRQGLYALPGETIIVHFSDDGTHAHALARIADSGAALIGHGPAGYGYRLHVIDPTAPRQLAREALVYRDPIESLQHCFGRSPDLTARLRH